MRQVQVRSVVRISSVPAVADGLALLNHLGDLHYHAVARQVPIQVDRPVIVPHHNVVILPLVRDLSIEV
jgi:hypothetical protein